MKGPTIFCLGLLLAGPVWVWGGEAAASLAEVHEWGTMTGVTGSDGRQFPWWKLSSGDGPEDLPDFVVGNPLGGKDSFDYIQRMETPVLYFYATRAIPVEISVLFQYGRITEYYPAALKPGAQKAEDNGKSSGALHWKLNLLAPQSKEKSLIPAVDEKGRHYAWAREVPDAWLVQRKFSDREKGELARQKKPVRDEVEKFIFYRGAADVHTPMLVSWQGEKTLQCTSLLDTKTYGSNPFADAWILRVSGGRAAWKKLPAFIAKNQDGMEFPPGASMELPMVPSGNSASNLEKVDAELRGEMLPALMKAGLSQSEAEAMLNT